MKYLSIVAISLFLISCGKSNRISELKGNYDVVSFTNPDLHVGDFTNSSYELGMEVKDGGDLWLNTPVNSCGGTIKSPKKGEISFDEMGCTMMAALDSMANVWESRYTDAIFQIKYYKVSGNQLTLTSDEEANPQYEIVLERQ